MFSTLTPHSFFGQKRRLERLPHQDRETSSNRYSGYNERVVVNQLNILASLDPKHSEFDSNISPRTLSFMAGRSSRASRYTSSTTSSRSLLHSPSCSRSSYEYDTTPTDQTPTLPSFAGHHAASAKKTDSKAPILPTNMTPLKSDSSSDRSWVDFKERKKAPPPLLLDHSNLHRKSTLDIPAIEIVAPGPPRVDSRLSSYSMAPQSSQPISPTSPELHIPTQEEIGRRRHQKVMKTLGEPVPAELVYQVQKIPNVTMFPEPPSPKEQPIPRESGKRKIGRRGSFTLSALLPASNHIRGKSSDRLGIKERSPRVLPPPRPSSRQTDIITSTRSHSQSTRYLPESPYVHTPIADTLVGLDQALGAHSDPTFNASLGRHNLPAEMDARSGRRASPSVFNRSPMRDSFYGQAYSPPLERHSLNLESPTSRDFYIEGPRSRPQSTALSPLVFSKHLSFMPPEHVFSLTIDDVDCDNDETPTEQREKDSAECGDNDPSPKRKHMYALSEGGNTSLSAKSGYHSNPHLPSQVRPETPFQNSGVPLEGKSSFLTPHEWNSRGNDLLQRKERRQGWSGEWNQQDIQDVIQKLRNLK